MKHYEKIEQKNIPGLEFFGEVCEKGLENFWQGLQDLFFLSEEYEISQLENQIAEVKGKKIILVKVPQAVKNENKKGNFYRAVLQEDIDTENIKNICSIRYYKDAAGDYYNQFICELAD